VIAKNTKSRRTEKMSTPDERCCGADVCIIDERGRCWCGQIWDGEKMVMPEADEAKVTDKVAEVKTKQEL